jgi:hypothetical protein
MKKQIKEKIALFQLNSDDTETRVGTKNFDSDKEALEAIEKPGTYIAYKVWEVTEETKTK